MLSAAIPSRGFNRENNLNPSRAIALGRRRCFSPASVRVRSMSDEGAQPFPQLGRTLMMQFNARVPARNFGLLSNRTVLGFRPQNGCPPPGARFIAPDPEYTFVPDFFERLRLWWECDDTSSPLYISGPAGCGKTSAVLQFMARVNAPCVTLTCRRRMDKYELIGQWGADAATHSLVWTDRHSRPGVTAASSSSTR